jgi:ABC-type transporter Mla MlaB component
MKPHAHANDAHRLLRPAASPERLASLEILVCGDLLVERRQHPERVELVLFGQLHRRAAESVEAQLLDACEDPVLLDLTHLDLAEPAALGRLADRQREEHQAGRQVLLRIAPEQVAQLNQP